MIHYKYVAAWSMALFFFIVLTVFILSNLCASSSQAVEAKITGDPKDHESLVTFLLPLETDVCLPNQTSCPENSYIVGYRLWLDNERMAVLSIQEKDLDVLGSHCEIYSGDFTSMSKVKNRSCTTQELSIILYYMPEELKNLIQ